MKSRNNVDDKKKKGPKGPNDQGPVKPKKQKRRRDDEDDANDQTNDQPPEQVRILFPFIFRAQPQHADNEDDDDEDYEEDDDEDSKYVISINDIPYFYFDFASFSCCHYS